MSKVDDELARAISEPAAAPARAPVEARPVPRESGASPNRSIGLLLALVGIAGGVVLLFMFGFKEAAIYSLPVSEITHNTSKFAGRKVRLEGELTSGTLVKRDQPCEYRFKMHGIGAPSDEVEVRYGQCVVPDTFRDAPGGGVLVTVEGTLMKEGHFEASLVMAKCSSKYNPSTHQMSPDKGGEGEPANTPIN